MLDKYIVLRDSMDFGLVEWDDDGDMRKRRRRLDRFRQGIFDQIPKGSKTASAKKPWRFSFDYTPKIINNKLYIGRFHRVDGPLVSWTKFAALLGSIHFPICHHLEFMPKHDGTISIQHTDRVRSYTHVVYDKKVDKREGSCPDCFADFDFDMTKDEVKGEWSVRFSTYHCLGSCRSPYDVDWSRLRNGSPSRRDDNGENLMQSEHPLNGRARQQWYECLDAECAGRL
jgi:hypothetical protein